MAIIANRATNILTTYFRPLLQTSIRSLRQYSTGPTPKIDPIKTFASQPELLAAPKPIKKAHYFRGDHNSPFLNLFAVGRRIMAIFANRATSRPTCVRSLLKTPKYSRRHYSTQPTPQPGQKIHKSEPIKNVRLFRALGKTDSNSFNPYAIALAICAVAYWFFNSLQSTASSFFNVAYAQENEPSKTLEMADENDLSRDFKAKIDARRFTIVDANNKKYDFGSYFHGYGKSLVRGMNLNFRKIILDNGTTGLELSFRINPLFQSKLQDMIQKLSELNPEEQQAFAHQCQARGIKIYSKMPYTVDKSAIVKKAAHLIVLEGLGSLMVGRNSYHTLRDQVKITLSEGATLESFNSFLTIFGLQDALKKSSDEDLERLKVGKVYRTFFPKSVYYLERSEEFFTLPVAQLKQNIIQTNPSMKDIFAQNAVVKHELFPGYVRYGVSVDKKVHALGGVALTTALTSLSDSCKTEEELDILINILKNGLFSQEMRQKNGIGVKGFNGRGHYKDGGSQSVYTQMLKTDDVVKEKRIDSFTYRSPVHLYLSLDVLNQDSYQYNDSSHGGGKTDDSYVYRLNIFDFLKQYLSDSHEIMVPDIVPPQHFKAMSVPTEALKQRIISRMRERNLLRKDLDGIERYNGVPVDEFIDTKHHITAELLKRCHD